MEQSVRVQQVKKKKTGDAQDGAGTSTDTKHAVGAGTAGKTGNKGRGRSTKSTSVKAYRRRNSGAAKSIYNGKAKNATFRGGRRGGQSPKGHAKKKDRGVSSDHLRGDNKGKFERNYVQEICESMGPELNDAWRTFLTRFHHHLCRNSADFNVYLKTCWEHRGIHVADLMNFLRFCGFHGHRNPGVENINDQNNNDLVENDLIAANMHLLVPPPGFRAPKKINDEWEVSCRTKAESSDRQRTTAQVATSTETAPQPTILNAGKEDKGVKNMKRNEDNGPKAPPSTPLVLEPPSSPSLSEPPRNEVEATPVTDGLISTPQLPLYIASTDPEYNIMEGINLVGVRSAVTEILGNGQDRVEISDTRYDPLFQHLIGNTSSFADAENQNHLREVGTSDIDTANDDEPNEEISVLPPQGTPVPEEKITSDEKSSDAPSPKMSPPSYAVSSTSDRNRSPAVRTSENDKRQNEGDQVGFLKKLGLARRKMNPVGKSSDGDESEETTNDGDSMGKKRMSKFISRSDHRSSNESSENGSRSDSENSSEDGDILEPEVNIKEKPKQEPKRRCVKPSPEKKADNLQKKGVFSSSEDDDDPPYKPDKQTKKPIQEPRRRSVKPSTGKKNPNLKRKSVFSSSEDEDDPPYKPGKRTKKKLATKPLRANKTRSKSFVIVLSSEDEEIPEPEERIVMTPQTKPRVKGSTKADENAQNKNPNSSEDEDDILEPDERIVQVPLEEEKPASKNGPNHKRKRASSTSSSSVSSSDPEPIPTKPKNKNMCASERVGSTGRIIVSMVPAKNPKRGTQTRTTPQTTGRTDAPGATQAEPTPSTSNTRLSSSSRRSAPGSPKGQKKPDNRRPTKKTGRNRRSTRSKDGKDSVPCEIEGCVSLFCTDWVMRRHVREVHGNPERRFQCTVGNCNRSFVRDGDLTKHVNFVHSQKGERCDYCNKMFKSEGSVTQHQRNSCKMLPKKDKDSDDEEGSDEEDLNEEQGSDEDQFLGGDQGLQDDQAKEEETDE